MSRLPSALNLVVTAGNTNRNQFNQYFFSKVWSAKAVFFLPQGFNINQNTVNLESIYLYFCITNNNLYPINDVESHFLSNPPKIPQKEFIRFQER